jgi:hypothetical protein
MSKLWLLYTKIKIKKKYHEYTLRSETENEKMHAMCLHLQISQNQQTTAPCHSFHGWLIVKPGVMDPFQRKITEDDLYRCQFQITPQFGVDASFTRI